MSSEWHCFRCEVEMEEKPILMEYMGFSSQAFMLKCPECGVLYCNRELAEDIKEGQEQIESKQGG